MSDKNVVQTLKTIAALAVDTARQQSRDRLFFVVYLFGGAMTLASLLFGAVSADQELDVIRDMGLLTTELFGLAAAALGAVTLILSEVESRGVYVVLARPIPRWCYIVGRALGLWSAIVTAMSVMAVFHVGLLLAKGGTVNGAFFAVYPFIAMKLAVVTGLGMFLSVFSTSSASALVFTACLWMVGHFTSEVRYMAEKAGPLAGALVKTFLLAVPDLQLLNARDALGLPVAGAAFWPAFMHAAGYTAASLALATALFSKKEF